MIVFLTIQPSKRCFCRSAQGGSIAHSIEIMKYARSEQLVAKSPLVFDVSVSSVTASPFLSDFPRDAVSEKTCWITMLVSSTYVVNARCCHRGGSCWENDKHFTTLLSTMHLSSPNRPTYVHATDNIHTQRTRHDMAKPLLIRSLFVLVIT